MEPNTHNLARHNAIQEVFDTLLCSDLPTVDDVYALVRGARTHAKEASSLTKQEMYLDCARKARRIAQHLEIGGTFDDANLLWEYAACVHDVRG